MQCLTLLVLVATCMAELEVLRFDWYYRKCNNYIAKNAALKTLCNTTASSAVKIGLAPALQQCLCKQENYRLSMYGCLNYAATQAGTKENSIKGSWDYFQQGCAAYVDEATLDYDTNKQAFLSADITQGFKQANSTASGPFIPEEASFPQATCKVYAEAHRQNYWAQMYPLITTWYIAGIMFVQMLGHWGTYLLPSFIRLLNNNRIGREIRRYVVLPAMFDKYRATPLKVGRWFVLVFPSRLHALFLTGYAFLSILFLAYDYPYVNDGVYWSNKAQNVGKYVGFRSGQLCMHKMIWMFVFAGRNNILIWLTGWQYEIFNCWHRWVSRLFVVDVLVHTIGYAIALGTRGRLPAEWSLNYMVWGFVAFGTMCLLCINGTKPVRQMAYEVFLYTHIILAAITVSGTWYHIDDSFGMNELYAVIAFWGFDRVVRFVRILVSNPMSQAKMTAHPDGTLSVDIFYSGIWQPRAGTYVFIHFMHPLYFIQSHPFTAIPLEENGKLRLYCKPHRGITRKMHQLAIANGGTVDSRVLIDGPYGVGFSTKQFKEVVLVAGGIGITAVYSHFKQIIKKGGDQIVQVHWVVSSEAPLAWFRKELEEMIASENANVTVYVNASQVSPACSLGDNKVASEVQKDISTVSESIAPHVNLVNFKPDLGAIVKDDIANSQGNILFFACGPPSMADTVRESVAQNLFETRHYVEFFEESFSM